MSSSTGWSSRADYVEATRRVSRPGDPVSYVVPRPVGHLPDDVTDFHVGQAHWSAANPPSILYELTPPATRQQFKLVNAPYMRDANGNFVFERWPRPGQAPRQLKDLAILPDRIGSNEEAWFFEAVRRLEPRITWEDISMRISPGPNGEKVHKNAFNQRLLRFRDSWCLLAWHQGRIPDPKTRASVANRLSDQQIAQNTSRGTTPGLVDPSAGESGGRVPIPLSGRVGAAPSTINQRTNRVLSIGERTQPATTSNPQRTAFMSQSQRLTPQAGHPTQGNEGGDDAHSVHSPPRSRHQGPPGSVHLSDIPPAEPRSIPTNQYPFGNHPNTEASPYTTVGDAAESATLTGQAAARAAGMTIGANGIPLPHNIRSFQRDPADSRDSIRQRQQQHRSHYEHMSAEEVDPQPADARDAIRQIRQRQGNARQPSGTIMAERDETSRHRPESRQPGASAPLRPWEGLNDPEMWLEEDAEGEEDDDFDAAK